MEEKKYSTEITDEIETFPTKRDYEEELIAIIQGDAPPEELRARLDDYHDYDVASVFSNITPSDRRRLYRALSDEEISNVFSYIENVEEYVAELDAERVADIVEEMDADDAVDLLEELEDDTRREIISLMDEEAAHDIDLITSFDEDSIGSRMTTNFIAIKSSFTVKQAMKSVIEQAAENDNVSIIYVTDGADAFCGAITLRDLVLARSTDSLDSIVTVSYPYLYATESVDDCIERIKGYREDSIPVLDKQNKIIGAITSADVIEVVDEEMGEDYARLAGLPEEEDLTEPTLRSVGKRIPWLIILLILSLGVSTVVGLFDKVIDSLAYLVFFQSMILGMAGNVGTQSLAVTVRVLSDSEVDGKTTLRLIFKEVRVGLVNGLIVGALAFAASSVYLHVVSSAASPVLSGLCIAVAMTVAMTFSSLFGTVIPVIFKRLKIDPAVASGPLITTVNDMVAVCVYYSLAMLLLMAI